MKVKRNTLLLLACLVWSAAGCNILRIGLLAYPAYGTVVNYLLSVLVFAVFQWMIFGKLVKKHTARIQSYGEERHFFLKFFDGKAFAIMAVMMSGGIGLRVSGLAPERFIAVFYTGLGAALLLAGLRVLLCMMPQNQWLSADAPLSWGIYRNIPFALLGLLIIVLFFRSAKEHKDRAFRWMWLTIVLSFGFYIPVVLWADTIPLIGMLMIPKTCAYVWTVLIGYFAMKRECN